MSWIITGTQKYEIEPPVSFVWSFDSTSPGANSASGLRLGYRFTLNADFNVTDLAVRARQTSFNEYVIIHRVSDGALITSSSILPTSIGDWTSSNVTPITLIGGISYVISSRAGGTTRNLYQNSTGDSFLSGVTPQGNYYSTSDSQPTTFTSNTYYFTRFGGNFI